MGKTAGWVKVSQTKGDVAEELYGSQGITYDTALPQSFINNARSILGIEVASMFVWIYPKGNLFGKPGPLTDQAKELMNDPKFQEVMGTKLSQQRKQMSKTAGWEIPEALAGQDQEDQNFDMITPPTDVAGAWNKPYKKYRGFHSPTPSNVIARFKQTIDLVSAARNREEAAGIIERFVTTYHDID